MRPLNASALSGEPSFPLGNRLFRAVWSLSWMLLAAWTPPPLHPWRRLLLRLFGARLGRGARVYASAKVLYPPYLTMGEHAVLGPHTVCYCMDRITLGDHVTISQYAHLVTGTHRIEEPGFQLVTKPIRIEAYAWVASGAFVGPGVTIGEGAVLGARGVAFRDLAPWTIYAGNPAKPIRQRPPQR
jgi:putative colanic acid biosynthesis acetyltransferase WcaF